MLFILLIMRMATLARTEALTKIPKITAVLSRVRVIPGELLRELLCTVDCVVVI